MVISISNDTWVYVVIGNPGSDEKLTGFQEKDGMAFIPVLRNKNDAEGFLGYIPRQPGVRYEIQTIIFEDVLKYARENGSKIYVVNEKGEILEKGSPETIQ
jgi:hypothetical protein